MKRFLTVAISLALTACATPQQTQTTFVQACGAYNVALNSAVQLRISGKLSPSEIDSVTLVDQTVFPLCTGTLPTDGNSALATVEAATANLILNIISKYSTSPASSK